MREIQEVKKAHASPYKRDRKFEKEYKKIKSQISAHNTYRIDEPRAYNVEPKTAMTFGVTE